MYYLSLHSLYKSPVKPILDTNIDARNPIIQKYNYNKASGDKIVAGFFFIFFRSSFVKPLAQENSVRLVPLCIWIANGLIVLMKLTKGLS